MKLRFSLRAMLVLTTVVGLACLWRSRPARIADQFARAVNAGHFDRADAMFHDDQHAFVARFMDRDDRNRATARVVPQSIQDWLRGTCRIEIALVDFEGLGAELQVISSVDALGLGESDFTRGLSAYTGFFDPQINIER